MERGEVLTRVLIRRMPGCKTADAQRELAGELGISYGQLINEWARVESSMGTVGAAGRSEEARPAAVAG